MDLEEALPLLQENHTAVATSVTSGWPNTGNRRFDGTDGR